MPEAIQYITVSQLGKRISGVVNDSPSLQGVWVVGELSDVNINRSSGHCYLTLLDKDDSGRTIASVKGIVWRWVFEQLRHRFMEVTRCDFTTGIKVMLQVSVNYHQQYGLSVIVSDILPEFTAGDVLRRRRENVARLTAEGIIDNNRNLPWPETPLNIAIISSPTAAGLGDFLRQLYDPEHNKGRLAFKARLFPAMMQGHQAPESIIEAFRQIYETLETGECQWDYVALIRGGGSSDDLSCFDNYELAAEVAQFPVPVIIGLGHERDEMLLDYVAKHRVSTPTACGQFFVLHGSRLLNELVDRSTDLVTGARRSIADHAQRLAYISGAMPGFAGRIIADAAGRLDRYAAVLKPATNAILTRRIDRLTGLESLVKALDPQATLNRGFSITRIDGRVVTSPEQVVDGAEMTTVVAGGQIVSTVKNSSNTI